MTPRMTPRAKLPSQLWSQVPGLRYLFSCLNAGGVEVRVVGGAVRDASLGLSMIDRDIDLATPTPATDILTILKKAKIKAVPTGIAYGTITAIVEEKPFEITTLRQDTHPQGRHTEVKHIEDWVMDASRRDFTINALYSDFDGTVYDPCGGIPDLKKGIVRFIGDATKRIQEDHLRILRFFRFYGSYGRGLPDGEALQACYDQKESLRVLSKERIRQEFFKILCAERPTTVLKLIEHGHLLGPILRVDSAVVSNRPLFSALTKLEHALHLVDPLRRFVTLLPEGIDVLSTWDFSNAEKKRFQALRTPHSSKNIKSSLYTWGRGLTLDHALLEGALKVAHGYPITKARDEIRELIGFMDQYSIPTFPIKGADLVALGIPMGPDVGRILALVEEWWIGQNFEQGPKECLSFAMEVWKNDREDNQ